jgi:hypothetical protein
MITNKMKIVQLKMREARFWPKMKFEPIFFQVLWQFLENVSQRVNAGEGVSDGAKYRIFQLVVCVRKNSNRFRPKFVGWAKFPPPAEAILSDLPAYRQAGRQAGWTISSFSLAANSFNSEI